jgi:hypothetical protein
VQKKVKRCQHVTVGCILVCIVYFGQLIALSRSLPDDGSVFLALYAGLAARSLA